MLLVSFDRSRAMLKILPCGVFASQYFGSVDVEEERWKMMATGTARDNGGDWMGCRQSKGNGDPAVQFSMPYETL